ncbi:MAG: hypothetical protein GX933_06650 [Chloroflexi bacterium]|nr:hypothetical protein [Chloroflexota bacterium]
MERSFPRDASESIDFYMRTIYSVLRSRSETRISGFEEVHAGMESMLHPNARSRSPDFSALIYSLLRLPSVIRFCDKVIFGQHTNLFIENGYSTIQYWQEVSARARRRYCLFDGHHTLACFITSKSDLDDLIPVLTAFQIEWNKFNFLLRDVDEARLQNFDQNDAEATAKLAAAINVPLEDLKRLFLILGDDSKEWLLAFKSRISELRVRLLDSSSTQYFRSANLWMQNILATCPQIANQPVFFISSNTHSVMNMISGYALSKRDELIAFMESNPDNGLLHEWKQIRSNKVSANEQNLLYYVLKKYQQTSEGEYTLDEQKALEQTQGIFRIAKANLYDIEAQIVDLSQVNPEKVDPRIRIPLIEQLKKSKAYLFNIDYPLGLTAFNILTKFAEEFERILGIYIMGKAASLNGIYGDVIVPTIVHDMHSENTYLFQNAFTGSDIEPWLEYGSILDNQRSVSVFGTFLQNRQFIEELYRIGYTDIEMEAGPYLSAVFEMTRPTRHPTNEIITYYNNKFDIGILHYVSDTPMSKGKNLGAGTLSYFGMDSTYACTTAILRRIFELESDYCSKKKQ